MQIHANGSDTHGPAGPHHRSCTTWANPVTGYLHAVMQEADDGQPDRSVGAVFDRIAGGLVADLQAAAGYRVTLPMLRDAGPCRREHVLNGNGTSLDLV